MHPDKLPIIRASEIGEYSFCARAWWLRRVCHLVTRHPERLQRGTEAHAAHGAQVVASGRLMWFGIGLLALALLLAFV